MWAWVGEIIYLTNELSLCEWYVCSSWTRYRILPTRKSVSKILLLKLWFWPNEMINGAATVVLRFASWEWYANTCRQDAGREECSTQPNAQVSSNARAIYILVARSLPGSSRYAVVVNRSIPWRFRLIFKYLLLIYTATKITFKYIPIGIDYRAPLVRDQ